MDESPNSFSPHQLPLDSLVSFLQLRGWELVDGNDRWYVFLGYEDAQGSPLEIVLPKNPDAPDYGIYVKTAVDLLSALDDTEPVSKVNDILSFDRDVLLVRNVEIIDSTSIPINLATKQVAQLRRLVAFAACSEEDAKPHFNAQLNIARRMVEHYRFGHTFSGSFGFRLESPVGSEQMYVQKALHGDIPDKVIIPLERRVMERILRGLVATRTAVEQRQVDLLINSYAQGFNANMCTAMLQISDDQKQPIEYSVRWSPKIRVSEDVANVGNIQIQTRHYEYLKQAARELRKLEPEHITIEGTVIALSSPDDPLTSNVIDRSVVIKWYRTRRRPIQVRVVLDKDDYIEAHKAHLDWNTISVSGIIQNVGGSWRLSEPHNFKIIR